MTVSNNVFITKINVLYLKKNNNVFGLNRVYSDSKSKVQWRNFEVHNEPGAAAGTPALHHVNIKTLTAFIKDGLARLLQAVCFDIQRH